MSSLPQWPSRTRRGACVSAMQWTRAGILAGAVMAAIAANARAQEMVTLAEAMARARSATPAARALASASAEADARVGEARAGYLPRIDLREMVQRGDQPVFVFSSLLSQRRFAAANFAVAQLNAPSPLTNIRTSLSVEQSIFDGGLTRLAVQGAELSRDIAAAERVGATQDLALAAAQAFVRVLQLEAADRANGAALAAAHSDLERARARRDAGMVTDADVLAVDVHLADVRQRQIATAGDLAVGRMQLADSLGLPLEAPLTLVRPVALPPVPDENALLRDALVARADRQQAELRVSLAENARRAAQARFVPAAAVQAEWEFNGSSWNAQRSSWVFGAQVQVNLFAGFGDAARLAGARHAESRAAAEREQVDRRIEMDVRAAVARLAAARAREEAGRAALSQSRESQRIVRDRYESGLATVTDVLRAAEAALDAESRASAAEMDVILEAVALERARGRL